MVQHIPSSHFDRQFLLPLFFPRSIIFIIKHSVLIITWLKYIINGQHTWPKVTKPYIPIPGKLTPAFSGLLSPYPGTLYGVVSGTNSLGHGQEISDLSTLGHTAPRTVTKLVPYRIKKIETEKEKEESRRLTRDEREAKNLNITFSVQYIINCSMEEFTDILNNKSLDNEQINLCRDIRRRGKNKVNTE